ncbi:MAG: LLM class flavin-dependent oxidoreductase, partial [Novosphingobium sp.]|nr:LLM class flavin-dependent oxidoreductase [Novosphingobium sp.]
MTVRVGLGPGLGADLSADELWQWIDLCEAHGIDSLWFSDQLLGHSLEPVAMLAAMAARTTRMRFGTSAIVAPFRDPVVLAKQFATIDVLSKGRLFPVLGVGNASDAWWAATGTSPEGRGGRSDEAITLLKLLLEKDEVSFSGTHYRYDGPGVQPRRDRPVPVWIGGNTPAAFRRTARIGDGWLGSMTSPQAAGRARKAIETALAETGRNIDGDHYGMTLMLRLGPADDPQVQKAMARMAARMPEETRASAKHMFVTGTASEAVASLRRYVDEGMSKFVLIPMAGNAADLIDQTERLAAEVVPVVE